MELTEKEIKVIEEKSKWGLKLGVIYIASSLSLEREWSMVLPDEISFHCARIDIDGGSSEKDDIWNMANSPQVEICAKQLASCEVDGIVFACTAGSFLGGCGWDEKISKRISDAAGGLPATTTSTGLLEAIKTFGCKKINMATPYEDNVTSVEKNFVESIGVKVANYTCEDCVQDNDIVRVAPLTYAKRIMDMYEASPDVDGTFISCTNSRTIEIIDVLEEKLNIPIFSSNQVSLFALLKKLGYKGKIEGWGSLFKYL